MQKLVMLAALVLLAAAGFAVAVWLTTSCSGPTYTFRIDPPPFLTDALAVEKSRAALALRGLDPADWRPREDRRSSAPDGTPDVYLARNGLNPNRGDIVFEQVSRQDPVPFRFVTVTLEQKELSCQVVRPR